MEVTIIPWKTIRHSKKYWILLNVLSHSAKLSIAAAAAAAAAKSLESCLTLCDPINGSPPGSPVLGISRQEHWSGLPFPSPMHESGKWKMKVKLLSRVRLLATPWTAAYQAPLSMYWSGVPLPSPAHMLEVPKSVWKHLSYKEPQTRCKGGRKERMGQIEGIALTYLHCHE